MVGLSLYGVVSGGRGLPWTEGSGSVPNVRYLTSAKNNLGRRRIRWSRYQRLCQINMTADIKEGIAENADNS